MLRGLLCYETGRNIAQDCAIRPHFRSLFSDPGWSHEVWGKYFEFLNVLNSLRFSVCPWSVFAIELSGTDILKQKLKAKSRKANNFKATTFSTIVFHRNFHHDPPSFFISFWFQNEALFSLYHPFLFLTRELHFSPPLDPFFLLSPFSTMQVRSTDTQ